MKKSTFDPEKSAWKTVENSPENDDTDEILASLRKEWGIEKEEDEERFHKFLGLVAYAVLKILTPEPENREKVWRIPQNSEMVFPCEKEHFSDKND